MSSKHESYCLSLSPSHLIGRALCPVISCLFLNGTDRSPIVRSISKKRAEKGNEEDSRLTSSSLIDSALLLNATVSISTGRFDFVAFHRQTFLHATLNVTIFLFRGITFLLNGQMQDGRRRSCAREREERSRADRIDQQTDAENRIDEDFHR